MSQSKDRTWDTRKKDGLQASTTGKGRAQLIRADQSSWRRQLQTARLKFDDDAKEVYLAHLSKHGLKKYAAMAAGITIVTVNNHKENDPEFGEAVIEAMEIYHDGFMDHAMTLAREGVEVKRFNKNGDIVEERRDYPIRLIELELKRIEPGYREKQTIDLNHAGGVMIAPAELTPEEWIKQQEEKNLIREVPEASGKTDDLPALTDGTAGV